MSFTQMLPNDGKLVFPTFHGNLEIMFIGVGSAFALKHNQTNFLLMKGDKHVMVDFGMSGPKALKDTTNLNVTDIDVILPTHSHADHIGGIEAIALMNRYVGQRFMKKPKTKMIINEEYQRVLWTSIRGGLEYNELLDGNRILQFSDFFDVIRPTWKSFSPRETWTVNYGGINIEMFRTNHIPEQGKSWEASFISYGMFIDDRVLISGDTKFDKDLLDIYADKAEVIFHDVQFFPGAVHAPLADLVTLPTEWKKKMLLVHYADNYLDPKFNDVVTEQFAGWTKQGVIYNFV